MARRKNGIMCMDGFLKQCVDNAKFIDRQKKKNPSIKSIFTIGSTSVNDNSKSVAYLTPVRSNRYFVVTGAVVFNQSQAISLAARLDGMVDIIAVDAEKKVPISAVLDKKSLSKDVLDALTKHVKTVEIVDSGNLASICSGIIKRSTIFEFKPNDLTVDAVWAFVVNKLGCFSGKKIAIIGAGNIGSKLAIKFVESGAEVVINRRDKYVGNTVANAINLIKPSMTIANVSYTENITKACFMADVVIGTSYGSPVIQWEHIAVSKQEALLLDVGKGSVSKNAITKAFQKGKEVYRIDVSAALEGHLLTLLRTDENIKTRLGRKVINGVGVVSGGLLGRKGDVVVDNVFEPKNIIGIANGEGDFLRKYSKEHKRKIKILKKDARLQDDILYQ